MVDRLGVVIASLTGGPMDGERRTLPSGWWTVEFPEIDRSSLLTALRRASEDESTPDELIASEVGFVRHVYERTGDWLSDGTVVFRYRYPNRLPAPQERLPKP